MLAINRLPFAVIGGKIPMEVWLDKTLTDYDKFRVFGCQTYYRVIKSNLDPKAKKAIFLGFSLGVRITNYGILA